LSGDFSFFLGALHCRNRRLLNLRGFGVVAYFIVSKATFSLFSPVNGFFHETRLLSDVGLL
jgi:hypothetical protein